MHFQSHRDSHSSVGHPRVPGGGRRSSGGLQVAQEEQAKESDDHPCPSRPLPAKSNHSERHLQHTGRDFQERLRKLPRQLYIDDVTTSTVWGCYIVLCRKHKGRICIVWPN